MKRTISGFVGLALLFLNFVSPARAARVQGTVLTSTAMPVSAARITLATPDTLTFRETRSAADGTYAFDGVGVGSWVVGASFSGRSYAEFSVVVTTGDVSRDFSLALDTHPGAWATIGDTNPENLFATDSGTLLPDGRIFYCHDTEQPVLFNPVTGAKAYPPTSPSQQGCHITTLLADGRLMFIGGQGTDDFRDAVRTVKTFNVANNGWLVLPSLFEERWYPGMVRLKDGRLLVMGGGQRPGAQRTPTCEIYDPTANSWTRSASMSNPADYPPSVLLYDGRVLRSWWPPQLYDVATNQWTNAGAMVQSNRFWPGHCDHMLVMPPDGHPCAVGIYRGSLSSPSMIERYDPAANSWSLGANASVTRSQPEVVMLPTGEIFVAGGKLEDNNPSVSVNAWGQTKLTDLYDPVSNSWRRCADMAWHREYHAVTVLIPDGRVVTTAGTGSPANPGISNDVEAFSPPCLFRGIRPNIDALSTVSLQNGGGFSVTVSRTNAITSLVLIGANATTHWVDGGVPRVLSLPFQQTGSTVNASIPVDQNLAPIGYYILFAMVDGIPSKGRIVRITQGTSGAPDDTPPTQVIARVWPNPFQQTTEFEWYQPQPERFALEVYDVSGRPMYRQPPQEWREGWHHFRWDGLTRSGGTAAPGAYWLRLSGARNTQTIKVIKAG